GARPTLSSRSEPFLSTIILMAFWKKAADALGGDGGPAVGTVAVGSDMRLDPEQDLAELDRRRVLGRHFAHRAGDFGLDLVHDLHRLDDAERLAGVDPGPGLHVR